MAKHAPGPWKATGYDVRQAGGRYIAYTGPHHTAPADYPVACMREDEANARLIAAAPDLLAACKEALEVIKVDYFRACEVVCGESAAEQITKRIDEQLTSAIAKAEGGAK